MLRAPVPSLRAMRRLVVMVAAATVAMITVNGANADASQSATSPNWDGYVAVGGPFREVQAQWTIPSLDCSPSTTLDGYSIAFSWVGLDDDDTVEQGGVISECSLGVEDNWLFWEMWPNAAHEYPLAGIGGAGDHIAASVRYVGRSGLYEITVTDTTTKTQLKAAEPCPSGSLCVRSAAEVITEGNSSEDNLGDYGAMTYTRIEVTNGTRTKPIGWWDPVAVTQEDSGVVKATVSPLEKNGSEFTAKWEHL